MSLNKSFIYGLLNNNIGSFIPNCYYTRSNIYDNRYNLIYKGSQYYIQIVNDNIRLFSDNNNSKIILDIYISDISNEHINRDVFKFLKKLQNTL